MLDYVRQLLLVQSGHPAANLLRFAGLIPKGVLEIIERAIQADEERLSSHE